MFVVTVITFYSGGPIYIVMFNSSYSCSHSVEVKLRQLIGKLRKSDT